MSVPTKISFKKQGQLRINLELIFIKILPWTREKTCGSKLSLYLNIVSKNVLCHKVHNMKKNSHPQRCLEELEFFAPQRDSDTEWKFGLAKLIRNMHRTNASPAPINLVTTWTSYLSQTLKSNHRCCSYESCCCCCFMDPIEKLKILYHFNLFYLFIANFLLHKLKVGLKSLWTICD